MNAIEKMKDSRRRIMLRHGEFNPILLPLELVEADPAVNIMGTAYTDGKVIAISSDFVDAMVCPQCGGSQCQHDTLQMHEAWHVGLLHCFSQRVKWLSNTDKMLFFMATDYVVNGILFEAGFHPIKDWLHEPKYSGWSLEQILEDLKQQAKKQQGQGKGKKTLDTHLDPADENAMSAAEKEEFRNDIKRWQKALADVVNIAKQKGTLGAGLSKLVDEALEPTIPWTRILVDNLSRRLGKNMSTWNRPSRRGRVLDLYLPSTYDLQVECVVCCFDTSGSMWTDPLLAQGFEEIKSLCRQMHVKKTVLIEADVEIKREEEVHDATLLSREIKGGGGTSFVHALKKAATYEPCLTVYFTDLCGTFPAVEETSGPVLWVTREVAATAPFGEILRVK